MQLFHDRADAGRRLAQRLDSFRGQDVVVLGVPHGGVPVAFEVAQALNAPLDVVVVRKLSLPFQPELAFGAIGEDGVRMINDVLLADTELTATEISDDEDAQRAILQRQVDLYRRGRGRVPLAGRVALIVDDAFATGATAKAACESVRIHGAQRIVIAAPVGAAGVVDILRPFADDVVCLETPTFYFYATVREGYRRFPDTSDDEVVDLLTHAAEGFSGLVSQSGDA